MDITTVPSDLLANLLNNTAVGANGVPGDVHGAAYSNGVASGNVQDLNGHGTFVSGIIASTTNNALLTAGIVQSVTLIPCKFIGASGTGQLSDALLCFGYCLLQKAHVISNSYGSISNSPAFETVVTKAVQQGALVVCSAGNSGLNTDRIPQYPSALSKTNMGILSVAAFGEDKGLWVNSNYGKDTVQVAAPGEQILGLGLAGATKNDTGMFFYAGISLSCPRYERMHSAGTSMACPYIAGVAALLLGDLASQGIDLTVVPGLPQALRAAITSSTVQAPTPEDQAKVPGGYLSGPGALVAFRSQPFYPANAKQSGVALVTGVYFAGVLTGVILTAGTAFALYVIRGRVKRARQVDETAAEVSSPSAAPTPSTTMT